MYVAGSLSEEFVNELYADWCEHGAEVLKTVRETRPDVYVKIVASLLPRVSRTDETSAIQVHHTIKRIILDEGASLAAPVFQLEAKDRANEWGCACSL
jgi:hypothetical protein